MNYSMTLRNKVVTATEVYNKLTTSIKNVYDGKLAKRRISYSFCVLNSETNICANCSSFSLAHASDVMRIGKIDALRHPMENILFGNPLGLPEGSWYECKLKRILLV
jgi:hypothetical protein